MPNRQPKPFIRQLRCKICRRRFKYPSSMIFHLQDDHSKEIQTFLHKQNDDENALNAPEVVHVSVIKLNPYLQ